MTTTPKTNTQKPAKENAQQAAIQNRIVVDATGLVFGRVASLTAHKALRNTTVIILNAEKAVINGNTENLYENYKTKLDLEAKGNPRKGPQYSKMPDAMFRRAVRGMLPFTSTRGQSAFRKVHIYIGVPRKYADLTRENWDQAKARYSKAHIQLGDFCKLLGAKWI